jgi:hypothetical protein
MTSRNGSNVSDDTIVQLRGELQALRNEVSSLRSQLGRVTGSEQGPVKAMPQITRVTDEPYSQDPRHDPEVVAALMAGEDPRPALRRARERIASEITARTGHQPISVGEADLLDLRRRGDGHEQRQAMARAGLDLTGLPVGPGGVIQRDAETGQVTVRFPAQPSCPNGHAAEPGYKFCATCGAPVDAPGLGEQWADELEQARQQNARVAASLSEEG